MRDEWQQQIDDSVPLILKTMIDRAIAGDTKAAKLILDRAVAPLKSVTRMLGPLELGMQINCYIRDKESESRPQLPCLEIAGQVITSTLSGKINPEAGQLMLQQLKSHAELKEGIEINAKIEELYDDFLSRKR